MPRLVIKHGKGIGRDLALGASPCVVGRNEEATQFVLDDHLVSRQHFRVVPEAGVWYVEDLASTNGTLVNGQKITRVRLHDGDVIQVGGTQLGFVQKDLLASAGPAAPTPSKLKGKAKAVTEQAQKPRLAPAPPPVPTRRKDKVQKPVAGDKPAPAPPVRKKKHLR